MTGKYPPLLLQNNQFVYPTSEDADEHRRLKFGKLKGRETERDTERERDGMRYNGTERERDQNMVLNLLRYHHRDK